MTIRTLVIGQPEKNRDSEVEVLAILGEGPFPLALRIKNLAAKPWSVPAGGIFLQHCMAGEAAQQTVIFPSLDTLARTVTDFVSLAQLHKLKSIVEISDAFDVDLPALPAGDSASAGKPAASRGRPKKAAPSKVAPPSDPINADSDDAGSLTAGGKLDGNADDSKEGLSAPNDADADQDAKDGSPIEQTNQ